MPELDDDALRAAMRAYLQAAERLDDAMNRGGSPDGSARGVLDLADAKTLAALAVRRRLQQLGWTPPGGTVRISGSRPDRDAS